MLQIFRNSNLLSITMTIPYGLFFLVSDWNKGSFRLPFINDLFTVKKEPIIATVVMGSVLYFLAFMISKILNQQKITKDPSQIPSILLILTTYLFLEVDHFSNLFLTNIFMILILDGLCKSYDKKISLTIIFNIGFLISISSLIHPVFTLLIIWAYFAILQIRNFDFTEFLIFISGVVVPYFFWGTWQFLNDNFLAWWKFHEAYFGLPVFELNSSPFTWCSIALCILLFISILLNLSNIFSKTSAKQKKVINALLLFPVFGILSLVFMKEVHIDHFLIFTIPFSVLLSLHILSIRNQLLSESIHLLIFLYCVGIHFQSYFFC